AFPFLRFGLVQELERRQGVSARGRGFEQGRRLRRGFLPRRGGTRGDAERGTIVAARRSARREIDFRLPGVIQGNRRAAARRWGHRLGGRLPFGGGLGVLLFDGALGRVLAPGFAASLVALPSGAEPLAHARADLLRGAREREARREDDRRGEESGGRQH